MKKENLLKITDLRHELHMYPELSMQEKETAERIKRFLQDNTHFRIIDRGDWFYAFNDRILENAVSSLAVEGINKVALLVFNRNEAGNAFWEKNGFTRREDLVYRNKALVEMVRIDT